jgi:hypothetical protein
MLTDAGLDAVAALRSAPDAEGAVVVGRRAV